jgi:hypothetical protein
VVAAGTLTPVVVFAPTGSGGLAGAGQAATANSYTVTAAGTIVAGGDTFVRYRKFGQKGMRGLSGLSGMSGMASI